MIKYVLSFFLVSIILSCESPKMGTLVNTAEELNHAISKAVAGDEIVMANGSWRDLQIEFIGKGTKDRPIILRAETPGKVFIEGISDLKFGGDYLEVHDLYFRNGYTPSNSIIEFRTKDKKLANHCRLSNCVIENFNQLQRDRADHWIELWGRHNQVDHCYIAGKSNQGPTIRIYIRGNESIKNFHQIVNNHFGPRPRKGGPRAETIQIGDSYTSMSPCHTLVANNLFEKCNGEVEVISSKTNFNEFRNNVFYKCEGSLVMRHGNYCQIDGNYFIGDESDNIGGVRIINTGHWVTNNYFYNLRGTQFKSPLAVMNGIPKSPLNRYNQVTDVVIAHNSWINCESPWHFGVGSNVSQSEVLPKSEIRSARPIRIVVANNIIYNELGDEKPLVAHDKMDGIQFESNIIYKQNNRNENPEGLEVQEIKMSKLNDIFYVPTEDLSEIELYKGFEFETIKKDLFGNSRSKMNFIGAISQTHSKDPNILDKNKYGTNWYSNEQEESKSIVHTVNPKPGEIESMIAAAESGDIILLAPGSYSITKSMRIDKKISIQSQDENNMAKIVYSGPEKTACFELHPYGNLTIKALELSGKATNYAFACLPENMSSLYNLYVSDSKLSQFEYILKAYKQSFADEISFVNTELKNCQNGIELSEETNDKGDYNVEYLTIDRCLFKNIKTNVIDYYRGGYDESTIGGNLLVTNSTFENCGGQEGNGILLNTRGIVNVHITNNNFKNNPVKLVALLWGAKNNSHSNNSLSNSGKIVVEENLKLKLLY